jgi:16S rRNA (guanine966-N2)-methyltransferase
VGLEALSRGAMWCGFVERDRHALATLRTNLTTLTGTPPGGATQILSADAFDVYRWSKAVRQEFCDLIFVDPPYVDTRNDDAEHKVEILLKSLAGLPLLGQGALVVLRHEARVAYDRHDYDGLRAVDTRRYGDMTVTYMTNAPE